MFELKDFNSREPTTDEVSERRHVAYASVPTYGSSSGVDGPYVASKFEDGDILTYFRSKRISRTWIKWWMVLQVLLLVYQLILYREVSFHSSLYDSVVKAHCNENEPGSCKSRLWQKYAQFDHMFDGKTDIRLPIPIYFPTSARTPLSVQIAVLPKPSTLHIPFEVLLKRHAKGDLPERSIYERGTTGFSSVVVTESGHHHGMIASPVGSTRPADMANWEGTIALADYPRSLRESYMGRRHHTMGLYHKFQKELKSVKILVAEMNNVELTQFMQNAPNCDFKKSWSNVTLQSMSLGSRRLSWIGLWLMFSVILSTVITFLVWNWYGGRRTVDGLNFHYLVAAKCLVQDMPLQTITLVYIFSWFEGGGGERCQLCLLDLEHCERMTPFHLSNFLLVALVLASSLSNQFLFTIDPTQVKTEDDRSFVWFARFVLACLTILPFSTAMVAFNGSLIDLPGFWHMVFLIPCFAGWVALFSLVCLPITSFLDNDEYLIH
jgi:hypothetical protein